GMVAEAKLAQAIGLAEPGLADEIASVLENLSLETQIPANLDREAMLRVMQFDKKRADQTIRFALPVRIGEVKVGVEIPNLSELIL
ncbi:MAG: 3-dehydroquinate synthase, partial [Chloroflexota bacterium]|nr:3-dehydroquinate synthase [Chloroflexota bacterium]